MAVHRIFFMIFVLPVENFKFSYLYGVLILGYAGIMVN